MDKGEITVTIKKTQAGKAIAYDVSVDGLGKNFTLFFIGDNKVQEYLAPFRLALENSGYKVTVVSL